VESFRITLCFTCSGSGSNRTKREDIILKMIDDLEVQPVDYNEDSNPPHWRFTVIFRRECESRIEALKWGKDIETEVLSKVEDVMGDGITIEPEDP